MPEIAAVFNVVPPAAESSTGRIVYFTYAMAFCCRTCICYSELDGSEPHTQYALPATALCYLKHDANEMHFYYDAQNRPAMVDFNGTYYMYLLNQQGDIVGLVDSSNTLVVEYKYDAWGRPTLKRSLTTAYDTLATLNPFR